MKQMLIGCVLMTGCSSVTYTAKERAEVKVEKHQVQVFSDGTLRCKVVGPVELKP